MTPQEKSDAKARGYQAVIVSGPAGEQWVDVLINGTQQGLHFGTEDEAWIYIQGIFSADAYNH
ncbi:hypothetical protein [Pseudomonas sp. LB3P14]